MESIESLHNRDLNELIEFVFHLLRVVEFSIPNYITSEFINILYDIVTSKLNRRSVSFNTTNEIVVNRIIDLPDKILKIAFLRDDIREISQQSNALIYRNMKYHFNNVYNNTYNNISTDIVNFINERVTSNKPVNLILCGYTGSGKSTLANSIIQQLTAVKFMLYQIYLNKIHVLDNFNKRLLGSNENIHDEKFIFTAAVDEISNIMNNFNIISETEGNKVSSRAHTIIKTFVNDVPVQIFDLCGFERSKKKLFHKESQENLYINKSLFSVTSYIKNQNYIDNKCILLQCLKDVKNMVFVLMFHDNASLNLYSSNHLIMFKDLFKITKVK